MLCITDDQGAPPIGTAFGIRFPLLTGRGGWDDIPYFAQNHTTGPRHGSDPQAAFYWSSPATETRSAAPHDHRTATRQPVSRLAIRLSVRDTASADFVSPCLENTVHRR